MFQYDRVILLAELAFEGFTGGHQFVPGFWVVDARFFPRFVVKVEDARGHGNWDPVQLAVDRCGLELFGIKLA